MENTLEKKVIDQAVAEIQNWLNFRKEHSKANELIKLFDKDAYFTISKSDYEIWKANAPEKLHAYAALTDDNQQLEFVLIDDKTDHAIGLGEQGDFDKFIKIKSYTDAVPEKDRKFLKEDKDGNITVAEANKRMNAWKADKNNWLKKELDKTTSSSTGLFVLAAIPFSDLAVNFEAGAESMFAFMALRANDQELSDCGCTGEAEQSDLLADIILWGADQDTANHELLLSVATSEPLSVDDAVRICPPSCGDGLDSTDDGLYILADA
jgi:hypothetical protein